jgi:hypothetical protein
MNNENGDALQCRRKDARRSTDDQRLEMFNKGEHWKLRKREAHSSCSAAGVARCRLHDALGQPYRCRVLQDRVNFLNTVHFASCWQLSKALSRCLCSFLFQLAQAACCGLAACRCLPRRCHHNSQCFLISQPYRPAANVHGQGSRTRSILLWVDLYPLSINRIAVELQLLFSSRDISGNTQDSSS